MPWSNQGGSGGFRDARCRLGYRGADGCKSGRGEPNPEQLQRYIDNGGFWMEHIPEDARYFKMANRAWREN